MTDTPVVGVSPTRLYARGESGVLVYEVDNTSGAIALQQTLADVKAPKLLAVPGTRRVFGVEPANGSRELSTVWSYELTDSAGLALHHEYDSGDLDLVVASDRFLYAVANDEEHYVDVFPLDSVTAAARHRFACAAAIEYLAPSSPVAASRVVYTVEYHSERAIYGLATYSTDEDGLGAQRQSIALAPGEAPQWIAIHPFGHFAYVFVYSGNQSYRFDTYSITADGTLKKVGSTASAGAPFPSAFVFDSSGRRMFVSVSIPSGVSVYDVDQGTGALSLVQTTQNGVRGAVAVHPAGTFLYVSASDPIDPGKTDIGMYTIDSRSGSLTSFRTLGPGDPQLLTSLDRPS